MAEPKANVLVVDDDEVVLVAIADLLEEAGYRVVTRESPIGATQVIVRENIDIAVLDVNLPVMQGDNMARLLQTWDRVKELPIVIISGVSQSKMEALQAELAQTRFVPKAAMNRLLLPTLDELLQRRDARRARQSSTRNPEVKANDLIAGFTDLIGRELGNANARWRSIADGSEADKQSLLLALSTLRGQAQLLGLEKPAQLIGALAVVVGGTRPGLKVPESVVAAVESAMAALLTLQRSPTAEFTMSPEPLQKRLMQSLPLLRDTHG